MQRRPFLKAAGSAAFGALASRAAPLAAAPRREAWSFVLLPDTQCYTESFPEVFEAQTDWIARQQRLRNIRFALQLGDITNNNVHPEWINARRAVDALRTGGVPHLLVPGNHDIGPWGSATDRQSHFSDYFIQRNARVAGESENAFLRVSIGDVKWLILGLEFGPRDAVVEWANDVMTRHPDHHAILITHAYLYSDGTRYDWGAKGREQTWNPNGYGIGTVATQASAGVNDGEALWRKLVSRHSQFAFTFNGHVLHDGIGHLESRGAGTVHQMLVNYQCGVVPDRRRGGGGFLRLVEVDEDGRTIQVRDYSPYYDEWLSDADRRFTITMDRDLNAPPAPITPP